VLPRRVLRARLALGSFLATRCKVRLDTSDPSYATEIAGPVSCHVSSRTPPARAYVRIGGPPARSSSKTVIGMPNALI
jgi:hypothetical protein